MRTVFGVELKVLLVFFRGVSDPHSRLAIVGIIMLWAPVPSLIITLTLFQIIIILVFP